MKELNELKHILSAEAFDAYLGELLKAQIAQRPRPESAEKPTKKTPAKKSGK